MQIDVLYIFSCAVLFATASTAIKEMQGELDPWRLPLFFHSPKGRSCVRFVRILVLACALALLVWGLMHLEFYLVFVNLGVAVIAACIFAALVRSAWFLYLGGILTAGITVCLWIRSLI
jgi:hypothetical protein